MRHDIQYRAQGTGHRSRRRSEIKLETSSQYTAYCIPHTAYRTPHTGAEREQQIIDILLFRTYHAPPGIASLNWCRAGSLLVCETRADTLAGRAPRNACWTLDGGRWTLDGGRWTLLSNPSIDQAAVVGTIDVLTLKAVVYEEAAV
jgi:hypothetical protein